MAVPKLRFKGFSDEWKTGHLRNNFSSISTNSYSRSLLNYHTGDVKNIHYGDIHVKFKSHFKVSSENVPYINDDVKISYSEECYCRKGDLIFADASEDLNDIGKSIEIIDTNDEKILAGLHTVHLRSHGNEFATGFGGYLLKTNSLIRQIQKEAQGAKVLGISASKILGLTYCSPSLEEQQKIADFFTTVDKKINLLKKKKELLEQYKKGVMQKIFSQELRFKDEQGKDFPEWEEKSLKEITFESYQGVNTTADKIKYHKTGTPILQAKHITGEVLNFEDVKFVDNITYDKYKMKYGPKINDILLTNIGTIGKTLLCFKTNFLIAWNIFKITPNAECIIPSFLLYTLRNFDVVGIFDGLVTGNATKFIKRDDILSLLIKLPSLQEQQKIADFLSALDDKIALVDQQINKTELWKKGLLQQMFV